jgi:hypothetical protein
MTSPTTTNGSVRKTPASQLDRLDGILDALSDGLDQAVATAVEGAVELAVRQAVGQAVRETLHALVAEALANPDLLAAFRGVAPTAPPPQADASPPDLPRGLLGRARSLARAAASPVGTACGYVLGQAARTKTVARAGWHLARRFSRRGLLACGVGVVAGSLTLWVGPWLGAGVAWVGGFVATLALQAVAGLRRLVAPVTALT